MDRFKLLKVDGKWTCTDMYNQVVCTFKENDFNGSQRFDFPPDIMVGKTANDLAKIVNEMAEWLRANHYSLVMPEVIDIRIVIGCTIRDMRMRKGLTQTELADRCGLSQTHIARIEQGRYNTTIDVLHKVVRALEAYIKIVDYNESNDA